MNYQATDEHKQQFDRDGYILVEGLFNAEEVGLLSKISRIDQALHAQATDRQDAQGAITRLSVQNELRDDSIYSAIVRSRRVAKTMEVLLGEEIYHYHHKLMLKEPMVGGAWEWHQDYGYWYNYGCLFPRMASCTIAIDQATKENGCLQVLRGSHQLGRIDHGKVGGQTGADRERVEAARERLELVYVEATPGSAFFFHGNLLHCSSQNRSQQSRWSLICCYNAASNIPYKETKHAAYRPLQILADQHVKEIGRRQLKQLMATHSE